MSLDQEPQGSRRGDSVNYEDGVNYSHKNLSKLKRDSSISSEKSNKEIIWLNNNKLTHTKNLDSFVASVLTNPETLRWIDISFNFLKTIDHSILKFPRLRIIYLHNNEIKDLLELDKLSKLEELRSLTLRGNLFENDYERYIAHHVPQILFLDFVPIYNKRRKSTVDDTLKRDMLDRFESEGVIEDDSMHSLMSSYDMDMRESEILKDFVQNQVVKKQSKDSLDGGVGLRQPHSLLDVIASSPYLTMSLSNEVFEKLLATHRAEVLSDSDSDKKPSKTMFSRLNVGSTSSGGKGTKNVSFRPNKIPEESTEEESDGNDVKDFKAEGRGSRPSVDAGIVRTIKKDVKHANFSKRENKNEDPQ